MIKLSIVVPVYNVEAYIEKCLYSLINQDIPENEYEIIVVNDGTKDNSANIAKEIASKHSNITVHDKSNGGLSSARNYGIDKAVGKYVLFIDSDDYLKENVLRELLNNCYDNDIDILNFKYQYVDNDGNDLVNDLKINYLYGNVMDGEESLIKNNYTVLVWASVYNLSFLKKNNLYFKHIMHEDEEFKPRAVFLAKRVLSIDYMCYCYLQRAGSISYVRKYENWIGILTAAHSLSRFIRKHGKGRNKELLDIFYNNINGLIYLTMHNRPDMWKKVFSMYILNPNEFKYLLIDKKNSIKYYKIIYKLYRIIYNIRIKIN